MLNYFCK